MARPSYASPAFPRRQTSGWNVKTALVTPWARQARPDAAAAPASAHSAKHSGEASGLAAWPTNASPSARDARATRGVLVAPEQRYRGTKTGAVFWPRNRYRFSLLLFKFTKGTRMRYQKWCRYMAPVLVPQTWPGGPLFRKPWLSDFGRSVTIFFHPALSPSRPRVARYALLLAQHAVYACRFGGGAPRGSPMARETRARTAPAGRDRKHHHAIADFLRQALSRNSCPCAWP